MVFLCVVGCFVPLPKNSCQQVRNILFHAVSILPLMQSSFVIFYLLAHLLFLVSHSFRSEVPGSGKVIAWTSSALFAYFRDITCPSSLFTLPPEQNNLWSHSFAFSSLKQKHFMPSTPPTAWVLYKGRCVPAASPLLCSPVLFLLCWQQMTIAFGGFGWHERGGDTHLPSLRVCLSGSAFPVSCCCPAASGGAEGSGIWGLSPSADGCQAPSCSHFVLMCIPAELGTSVLAAFESRGGCLQSPTHSKTLLSLVYWIPQIPTGFEHPGFPNPKKQKQASTSFLSSLEHVPCTEMLWVEVWHDTAAGWPGAVIDPLL